MSVIFCGFIVFLLQANCFRFYLRLVTVIILSTMVPLDNGVVARKTGCPLSANSSNIFSAMLSQAPCGLFSEEYHFFSELGPRNDHCPIPNLLASDFTDSAFLKHSSMLSFLSQEMSLNIDINRILPVKFSGVCPKFLRRSLILSQSCNVVNPGNVPLEFSRLSIDTIIISVAFLRIGFLQPCSSKLRWIQDVEEPFQSTTQNPRIHRLLCVEN